MSVTTWNRWRMGLAEATLQYIVQLGFRQPTEWTYRAYSSRRPQSQGGLALHGYENITMMWSRMDERECFCLMRLVEAARAASPQRLYLTLRRNDGSAPGGDWIDVYGNPHLPDYQALPGGVGYEQVTLTVNDVHIVNEPAEF